MELKVLGPLEAHEGSLDLTPSAAKPRQVLALMATQVGKVVGVPALIEELWGSNPPRSALTTLQTYVMQLRRAIESTVAEQTGRDAKEVLVTCHGGYCLDVDPDDVDLHRYEELVAAGRRAFDIGDHGAASRLLREALSLWRGPALVDVEVGDSLSLELTRIEENHMATLERCIESEMQLGRYHDLLSELAELTARYPMHESFCAEYMVALYRAGRQWQSLEAFTRLRNTLIDELGVDPSERLQQVHSAILNSDRSLDESGAGQHLVRQLAG
jgi:SARP family transcriptional regulator, regulator of embCAB operon